MTWELLAALITIVSCLIALGGVLVKLITTLTKLNVTLDALQNDTKEHKAEAKSEFKNIHETLNNHETRIHDLEVNNK